MLERHAHLMAAVVVAVSLFLSATLGLLVASQLENHDLRIIAAVFIAAVVGSVGGRIAFYVWIWNG